MMKKNVSFLTNKRILLGITGSIAAYKSADLVRRLREEGAHVRVVMTENAKRFITPLTMQAVSGFPIYDDTFDTTSINAMRHIELVRWADLILIAPASADCMARLVDGRASDLLTTICLAAHTPIYIAPAMNQGMWRHPTTRENVVQLQKKNDVILEPDEGLQACGDTGPGRMMDIEKMIDRLKQSFANGLFSGLRVCVTAGPTQEAIDPIRYLSNRSSGKMGFAIANAAHESGALTTLIHGPVSLIPNERITSIAVQSAQEMHDAVMQTMTACDIFFAVAAVSDYRPEHISQTKLHKQVSSLSLSLIRNPDIVDDVSALTNPPFIVGFTIETEDLIQRAREKRIRKKMNIIVANAFHREFGIEQEDNEVTVIDDQGEIALPRMSKDQLARRLIERVANAIAIQAGVRC